jgi:hypothetical protein
MTDETRCCCSRARARFHRLRFRVDRFMRPPAIRENYSASANSQSAKGLTSPRFETLNSRPPGAGSGGAEVATSSYKQELEMGSGQTRPGATGVLRCANRAGARSRVRARALSSGEPLCEPLAEQARPGWKMPVSLTYPAMLPRKYSQLAPCL